MTHNTPKKNTRPAEIHPKQWTPYDTLLTNEHPRNQTYGLNHQPPTQTETRTQTIYLLTYALPLALGTAAWHLNHSLGIATTIITTILLLTAYRTHTRKTSTHKKNQIF